MRTGRAGWTRRAGRAGVAFITAIVITAVATAVVTVTAANFAVGVVTLEAVRYKVAAVTVIAAAAVTFEKVFSIHYNHLINKVCNT